MEIQPIVIGTAGHIDHGKSTLVRALTGVDPDRLKEEKERGLTIDLGFAPLELPDGRTVGIVDVPGHERFIKNMVAGASGIDLVVLVVAADDGVMPQTREHLAIMDLLGVSRGLVALTKIDMVEPELAELAEEDVREAVADTFLADAPIHGVSAVSGEGLEAFKEALFAAAGACPARPVGGLFRMPVQRVFSSKGFGTILTGIPVDGVVRVGETLEVLPGGHRGKVRGLQAYRQGTDEARAGHSTAVNLADVGRDEVRRGCVLATPGFFRAVRMVGARLRVLEGLERPFADRTAVRLHTGTAEVLGEAVLLDAPEIPPGGAGLVQFRLEEPVVCAPGDPFIVRLASPSVTLGGGVILEESRYRLKRFKGFVLDELERQEASLGSTGDLLEVSLLRLGEGLHPLTDLAVGIKRPRGETAELLAAIAERGGAVSVDGGQKWIHTEALEGALERLRAALAAWFERNPLRDAIDVRDLRGESGLEASLLDALLDEEQARGGLQREAGGRVRLCGREVELDPEVGKLREAISSRMRAAGFQPPSVEELAEACAAQLKQVSEVVEMMVDLDELEHLGKGQFMDAACVGRAREEVIANCERNGALEIPELRDALKTTRKFLIPLLEHLDAQGLTLRQGGRRVLRRR
ncbi:MAG: selenocysteine-specific translation elongation factor [Planctomycetota bacterium]|nr:selenocysteine-specific translation elongation factor [Planctomycetota bacterium]MDP6764163.1 selenocysteine-specific translation elongation factor [Planctomycetota bacterium]MDP6989634.1 selenocysteine-specific translation elongation factor [Planctomycetota bacterium]